MTSLKLFILLFSNILIHADAKMRRAAAGGTSDANRLANKNDHSRVRGQRKQTHADNLDVRFASSR
jgi:hypothetical protein